MVEHSPQSERSSSSHIQIHDIFVGRKREFAELTAALDDALSGQGRLSILVGRAAADIAEVLFISPRTVTTHVSNSLNKISAVNRAAAATYATRQGLV